MVQNFIGWVRLVIGQMAVEFRRYIIPGSSNIISDAEPVFFGVEVAVALWADGGPQVRGKFIFRCIQKGAVMLHPSVGVVFFGWSCSGALAGLAKVLVSICPVVPVSHVGGPFKALVAGVGSIGFPEEGEFWAVVRILPVFILINGEECRKALSFVITPRGGLFSILGLVEGPWEVQLVAMIHPAG